MPIIQNRRRFLAGLTAAGAASLDRRSNSKPCRATAGDHAHSLGEGP